MSRESDKLRVLLYQFFPGGGIGRYTHELATAFSANETVDVQVVCTPQYEFLQTAQYPTWPGLASIGSRSAVVRRCRFLTAQLKNPLRLLRYARCSKVDVLHFSNINHLTFPVWDRWLQTIGCGVVATAHDVRRAKSIVNRQWEERALRSFYARCDALFVHSKSQKAELQKFAPVPEDRIHIVPHGPYKYSPPSAESAALRAKYAIPLNRPVALVFGAIRDDKNLAETLRGVATLEERPLVFVAGRGGAKGNLPVHHYRQLVHELQLENDVVFCERFIQDEEVGDLFTLSDFVLLTYQNSFTSQSGVLNIAVHYRKPVVVTPAPTMRETVERFHLGSVCSSDKAESIAAGIRQLRSHIGQSPGADFDLCQRENSWNRNAEITTEVYKTIANCKGLNTHARTHLRQL